MSDFNRSIPPMTSREFREITAALGLNIQASGRFLGVSRETVKRYSNGGEIPSPTAILLRLMRRANMTPATVRAVVDR